MTRKVEIIQPDDSLQTAARKMRDHDIGFLPVFEGDQLVGVLTDRDLVVRALANGTNSNAILGRDLMTSPVIYCFDDQDVEEAAHLMHANHIRRLVILGRRSNRMVGIVSLGDLAEIVDDKTSGKLLQSVSTAVVSR